MKKICICLCSFPLICSAQFGIKGGLNFANVQNAADISNSNRTGFMAGFYFNPPSKGIVSSGTEILFSRQGYNFQSGAKSGGVTLNYIILPQLMGISITKYVRIQLGAQMAYLLNAKADSSESTGSSGPYPDVMSYYNRFDYGFAAGVEVMPVNRLMIGARWNISLGKLYKEMSMGQPPSFYSLDAKNNLIQVYAGLNFGKSKKNKKSSQENDQQAERR